MTPQEYDSYSISREVIEESIKRNAKEVCRIKGNVSIDINRLPLVWQGSDEYKAIAYPTKGYECRTLYTSGIFPIVVYMVLKYYKIDVTLEDLVRIALWGDWHHANGTWHHYLDVMCEAYGLKTTRVTTVQQLADCIKKDDGLAVAMVDNSILTDTAGNTLVVIIKISDDEISFYYPGDGRIRTFESKEIMEHAKMLWIISEQS